MEYNPQLPQKIKAAFDQNRLVVFVGAGISRLEGCKGWADLANILVTKICDPVTASLIAHSNIQAKEKITIAYETACEEGTLDQYWEIFASALRPQNGIAIYDEVRRFNSFFVTTNCDDLLEKRLPANAWSVDHDDEILERVHPPYLFYLHGRYGDGCPEEQDGLVFTVDSYLKAYQDPSLQKFLNTIFSKYTVLFIGYGLSEFELLDFLLEKSAAYERGDAHHFILEGYFSYEEKLCIAKQRYYKSIGVELIPYCKDKKGYDQQLDIIQNWVSELLTKTYYQANVIRGIHRHLEKFNKENKDYILFYLEENPEKKEMLFREILATVPSVADAPDWTLFLWNEATQAASSDELLSSFLEAIRRCLKEKSISSDQISNLIVIVKKIVSEVSSDQTVRYDKRLRFQVVQTILILPASFVSPNLFGFLIENLKTDFFRAAREIGASFTSIEDWGDDRIEAILKTVYSYHSDRDTTGFSILPDFTKHIVHSGHRYAKIVCCLCFLALSKRPRFDDYYNELADRLAQHESNHVKYILQSLLISMDAVDKTYRFLLLEEFAHSTTSRLQAQALLYLSTKEKANGSFLLAVQENPLHYMNCWLDLYRYIAMCNANHIQLDKNVTNHIGDWIQQASFGLNAEGADSSNYQSGLDADCNTYRFYLYDQLRVQDTRYEECYQYFSKKEHHTLSLNPSDGPESTSDKKRRFGEEKLSGLSGKAIWDLTKMAIIEDSRNYSRFVRQEIYREMLESVIHQTSSL